MYPLVAWQIVFILETDRDDITLSRIISSSYIFLSLFLFTAWIASNGMKSFSALLN